MGTLVSPILSETLAMPFARRWMERHAWEEREARLSIVDDAGVDDGGLTGEMKGFKLPKVVWSRVPSCSGPSYLSSNRKSSNSHEKKTELRNSNWASVTSLYQKAEVYAAPIESVKRLVLLCLAPKWPLSQSTMEYFR